MTENTPNWVLLGFADPEAVSLWKRSLKNFAEAENIIVGTAVTRVATVRNIESMTGNGFSGFMIHPVGSLRKIAFLAFSMDSKYDNDPGFCLYWGPVADCMTLSQLVAYEDPDSKFIYDHKYVSYSDQDAFEAGLNWEVEETMNEFVNCEVSL